MDFLPLFKENFIKSGKEDLIKLCTVSRQNCPPKNFKPMSKIEQPALSILRRTKNLAQQR